MIIDLKNVNKSYPGAVPLHVLKDVNLQIEKGELVSIMEAQASPHFSTFWAYLTIMTPGNIILTAFL